jgi:hypothetical protein
VEVILVSGHRLGPFWDAEADALRAYLTGEGVVRTDFVQHGDLVIVELICGELESATPTTP